MNALDMGLKLLDGIITGAIALERLDAIRDRMAAMKAEGRDPTDEEWAALFSAIDVDSARLDEADKRLDP